MRYAIQKLWMSEIIISKIRKYVTDKITNKILKYLFFIISAPFIISGIYNLLVREYPISIGYTSIGLGFFSIALVFRSSDLEEDSNKKMRALANVIFLQIFISITHNLHSFLNPLSANIQ